LALTCSVGFSESQPTRFVGQWVNENKNSRGFQSMSIGIQGAKATLNFGREDVVIGLLHAASVDANAAAAPAAIVAILDSSTSRRVYVVTSAGEKLRMLMSTEFREGRGGRSDYYVEHVFVRAGGRK
jgi:hypothetical protein